MNTLQIITSHDYLIIYWREVKRVVDLDDTFTVTIDSVRPLTGIRTCEPTADVLVVLDSIHEYLVTNYTFREWDSGQHV